MALSDSNQKKSEATLSDTITGALGVGGLAMGTIALAFPDQLDKRLGFGLQQSAWGSFSLRSVGMRNLVFGIGLLTARGKNRGAAARWQALFGLSLAVDSYSCLVEQKKPGANIWMTLTAWGLPLVSGAALLGSLFMKQKDK